MSFFESLFSTHTSIFVCALLSKGLSILFFIKRIIIATNNRPWVKVRLHILPTAFHKSWLHLSGERLTLRLPRRSYPNGCRIFMCQPTAITACLSSKLILWVLFTVELRCVFYPSEKIHYSYTTFNRHISFTRTTTTPRPFGLIFGTFVPQELNLRLSHLSPAAPTYPLREFEHLQIERVALKFALNTGEWVTRRQRLHQRACRSESGNFFHSFTELYPDFWWNYPVEI